MLTRISLRQIKPYEANPRDNSESISKVKESIRKFGYKQPIVVDKDFVIIAGHTRYSALLELFTEKQIGEEIDVIVASDLTDTEVRAYRLADNKVAEFSDWDYGLLANEIIAISSEIDMTVFGFEDFTIPEEEEPIIEEEDARESVTIKFNTELVRVFKDDYEKWLEEFQLSTGKSIYEYLMTDMGLLTIKRNYDLSQS